VSRRPLRVALVALLLAGLAGCGIPERTEVEVDYKGEIGGAGSFEGRSAESPARTASGSDPRAFVDNFLAAAAGEPEGAYERVKLFIAPPDRTRLPEKQGSEVVLNVVRLTVEDPLVARNSDDTWSVRVPVQQLGQLRADGTLGPPVATEAEYRFQLRSAASDGTENPEAGLFVVNPPNVLLLSDEALRSYYRPRTIYFWSSDQTRLVPDQRYLPVAVPADRWVTETVQWLTGGPAEWLAPTVARLPDRTDLINNATQSDGRWEINLDLPGEDRTKLDRLATQLVWSLPELDGELELKNRNQTRWTIQDAAAHRRANPAYPLADGVQRFAVYQGAVHPLALLGGPVVPVPVIPEENRNITSAALSRSGREILAAFVVPAPNGRQRLKVGTGPETVRVFRQTAETFASVGRPVWIKGTDPLRAAGLVVADGRLYSFGRGAGLTPVASAPQGVTSVGVALDGRRIAVVARGALYVAALSLDGEVLTAGPARRLATSLTELSVVDWGGENSLTVAGTAGQQAVYEVSVDGAVETPLTKNVGARVTHLAAYPTNSVVPLNVGQLMYEANGVVWAGTPFDTIGWEQVQGVAPPPAGVQPGSPTAPFFLY
jgi:hypothetical protein